MGMLESSSIANCPDSSRIFPNPQPKPLCCILNVKKGRQVPEGEAELQKCLKAGASSLWLSQMRWDLSWQMSPSEGLGRPENSNHGWKQIVCVWKWAFMRRQCPCLLVVNWNTEQVYSKQNYGKAMKRGMQTLFIHSGMKSGRPQPSWS